MTQLKKLMSSLWKIVSRYIPKKTPKGTIMWIEVPMSFNSIDDKTDIIIETINHLERTIKIKKNEQRKVCTQGRVRKFV